VRYDSEHKQRTRLRLLTEAAMLLRENGPDGLSVATLMKRQGLTHGGFYAHFESKEDLIEQAIEVMFDKTCERFAVRTRGLSPHQGLKAYIEHYLSPTHVNRAAQGCPVPACAGDVARLGASARRRFEAGLGRLQSLIGAQFEMMGFAPNEAYSHAVVLLSELAGAVVMARAVKSSEAQKHITENARQTIIARLERSVTPSADDVETHHTPKDAPRRLI
jgi:TetR/AcrR family transcriptional regulator, transcriptional repressor for nem operon